MRGYFLIALCFAVLLITLFAIHINDKAFFLEGAGIISIFCIPFLFFALIAGGISRAMRKETANTTFQKPFRNLQLLLSGIYLVFIIINFNLLSFSEPSEDCDESNIQTLSGPPAINDTIGKRNLMAYRSLKKTLLKTSKKLSDTSVCITAVEYLPVDTIINNQKMKAKIILALTISQRPDTYYLYMFYCNDSVGFGIDKYPNAILN